MLYRIMHDLQQSLKPYSQANAQALGIPAHIPVKFLDRLDQLRFKNELQLSRQAT